MKTIRRVLALLLALSVVLALGVGVLADGETAYTITVKNGSDNISIKGCEYYAYRLFDATYSGDNVAYTVNENFKDFTYKVSNSIFDESTEYGGTNDNTLIDYLRTVGSDTEELDRFAKAALLYITENKIEPTGTATANPVGDLKVEATINVRAPGYYLVTGSAKAGEQLVTAACSLTTAKPTAEIKLKADAPTVEKKIVEEETITGEDGQTTTTDKLVDANTASIGDKVNYKITSSVPDMTGYNSYWFVLEDTLSKGLTYNDDIVVTVGGKELEAYSEGAEDVDNFGYKATATKNADGTTSIEIVLHNFIQYKNNTTKDIVVTYSATVNQDAELDPEVGNPNKVKLIYSNNPNVDYSGKDAPKDETDKTHVGVTPEDKVNTFVTGIKLTKTDGGNPAQTLTGAKFQISGTSMKVVLINKEIYKESTSGTYYMLKNGTYTTTAPTDETANQYDSITTKYEKVEEISKSNVTETFVEEGYVDENGVLTFEGLGEGIYEIEELVAPNGYNLLKEPITITISKTAVNENSCTWKVTEGTGENPKDITMDATTKLFPITVENNAGTELPSTGGMGTTLFYVIGGLLVVCAGVILVTRKRMSREG